MRPNPSIERTRSGSAGLAFISFWAKPAPPPRAAHVKRQAAVTNHQRIGKMKPFSFGEEGARK